MKNIIHFIVAFLIFASIQSAEAVVGGNGRSAGHENIGFVPGQIIVKFHTE